MTGAARHFSHQSMYWSDIGPEIGYEAIGICDSSLPTLSVWAKSPKKEEPAIAPAPVSEEDMALAELKAALAEGSTEVDSGAVVAKQPEPVAKKDDEDFSRGVVFYMRDDVVVGIILWNIFGRIDVARAILRERTKYTDPNELVKLISVHEH
eukprot:Colp12_sorted_trinity150504_noHs@35240